MIFKIIFFVYEFEMSKVLEIHYPFSLHLFRRKMFYVQKITMYIIYYYFHSIILKFKLRKCLGQVLVVTWLNSKSLDRVQVESPPSFDGVLIDSQASPSQFPIESKWGPRKVPDKSWTSSRRISSRSWIRSWSGPERGLEQVLGKS